MPLAELRTAMGDHVLILVQTLVGMAVILAIVGALGLASTLGIGVVERTREIAVLKTLGATPAAIRRRFLAEGLFVAAVSYVLGVGLSIPLTLLVNGIVGNLGFMAPLHFVFSSAAALAALGIGGIVTFGATLVPASRAANLSIRDALERT